jgi:hypothetical protein
MTPIPELLQGRTVLPCSCPGVDTLLSAHRLPALACSADSVGIAPTQAPSWALPGLSSLPSQECPMASWPQAQDWRQGLRRALRARVDAGPAGAPAAMESHQTVVVPLVHSTPAHDAPRQPTPRDSHS